MPKKTCKDPNKIKNPRTNYCVKKDGAIGRRIQGKAKKYMDTPALRAAIAKEKAKGKKAFTMKKKKKGMAFGVWYDLRRDGMLLRFTGTSEKGAELFKGGKIIKGKMDGQIFKKDSGGSIDLTGTRPKRSKVQPKAKAKAAAKPAASSAKIPTWTKWIEGKSFTSADMRWKESRENAAGVSKYDKDAATRNKVALAWKRARNKKGKKKLTSIQAVKDEVDKMIDYEGMVKMLNPKTITAAMAANMPKEVNAEDKDFAFIETTFSNTSLIWVSGKYIMLIGSQLYEGKKRPVLGYYEDPYWWDRLGKYNVKLDKNGEGGDIYTDKFADSRFPITTDKVYWLKKSEKEAAKEAKAEGKKDDSKIQYMRGRKGENPYGVDYAV